MEPLRRAEGRVAVGTFHHFDLEKANMSDGLLLKKDFTLLPAVSCSLCNCTTERK